MGAREARMSRKVCEGEGVHANICDISSFHTFSHPPSDSGVPNAKVELTQAARSEPLCTLLRVLLQQLAKSIKSAQINIIKSWHKTLMLF